MRNSPIEAASGVPLMSLVFLTSVSDALWTPSAPYEKSKFLGSGGSIKVKSSSDRYRKMQDSSAEMVIFGVALGGVAWAET